MFPQFSRRLPWSEPATPFARALARARAEGPLWDLTVSNPSAAGLTVPEAQLAAALTRAPLGSYAPDPRGLLSAREAVARYYAEAHGCPVDPEDVLLTASTSEAYALLFKLLCDPGDSVLAAQPSYPLFEHLAALESVQLEHFALRWEGGWTLDPGAVEAALHPRTRALLVVSPNNPTGNQLDAGQHAALLALCEARAMTLVVDEVFLDYPMREGGGAPSAAGLTRGACVVLSGLSKVCALPQLKAGWIVLSGDPAWRQRARDALELLCDAYLSVGGPVQHALAPLLEARGAIQDAIRARVRANLAQLDAALRARPGTPCTRLAVEGGWCATLQLPATRSEEQWCTELLSHARVAVQPGYLFDFGREAFVVVSLLPEPARFAQGVARLLTYVEE